MSPKEAYEKLGLPVGTDLDSVQSKFNEMYNDFRMMIDNAPTPKLRESFESSLSELEDAFKIINVNEAIDSSEELPMMNQTQLTANDPQLNKKDLQTIFTYFGFTDVTTAKEMKHKFNALTKSLKSEISKQSLPQVKQIYQDELDKATDFWNVLLLEVLSLTEDKSLVPTTISQPDIAISSASVFKSKKTFIFSLIAVILIVVILIFKNGISSEEDSLEQDFSHAVHLFNQGRIDASEKIFFELYKTSESMKYRVQPWLDAVNLERNRLNGNDGVFSNSMEATNFDSSNVSK